jgi:hypothetical protein
MPIPHGDRGPVVGVRSLETRGDPRQMRTSAIGGEPASGAGCGGWRRQKSKNAKQQKVFTKAT